MASLQDIRAAGLANITDNLFQGHFPAPDTGCDRAELLAREQPSVDPGFGQDPVTARDFLAGGYRQAMHM